MISNGYGLRVKILKFFRYHRYKKLIDKKSFCHSRRQSMSCRVHCEASINAFKKVSDVALILCVRRKRNFSSFMQSRQQKGKKCLLKCISFRNCISRMDVSFKWSRIWVKENTNIFYLPPHPFVFVASSRHHRFESFLWIHWIALRPS